MCVWVGAVLAAVGMVGAVNAVVVNSRTISYCIQKYHSLLILLLSKNMFF